MTKGKVFLVPFPYDDLSANKLRPALCLTNPLGSRRHVILAYITSRIPTTLLETDIELDTHNADFAASGLRVPSTIRLHQVVTVSTVVISAGIGRIVIKDPSSNCSEVEQFVTRMKQAPALLLCLLTRKVVCC